MAQSPVSLPTDGSSQMQLDVRFRGGIDLFSPQGTVSLEVCPVWIPPASTTIENRSVSLHVAVYPNVYPEQSMEHSGGFPNLVSGIPGKKQQESEKKGLVYEQELSVSIAPDNPPIPVTFLAPAREGVYQIVLTLQQKKESSSQSLWSLSSISSNPLQRSTAKVLAETSCQCVVIHPHPSERPVGDLSVFMEKELLETLDTTSPRSKRWAPIPALPKVANLSTPKLPELPKLYQFRDRPANPVADAKNSETDLEENYKEAELFGKDDTGTNINVLPDCVHEFIEQFNTRSSGPYGSGHFKQGMTESKENQPSNSNYSILEPSPEYRNSWEAFPLAIRETDKMHLIEIEYPTGHTQALGILIFDLIQDKKGKTIPVLSANCGFYIPEEIVPILPSKPTAIHRILFHPKSKRSILLLANRSSDYEAMFGKLSLYRVSEKKTEKTSLEFSDGTLRLPLPFDGKAIRTVSGYIHSSDFLSERPSSRGTPNFVRNFFGENAHPSDWQASYEAVTGLIEQLRRNGSDGLMFNAASKHGILYPSLTLHYASEKRISNTPGNPSAKDSLELMLRLFDREKLSAVPTIDFNMLLPVIENRLYQQPELSNELLYVDLNGKAIEAAKVSGIKLGVNGEQYNLLHPDIQEAMVDVLGELVSRCSLHSSFSGVGIILSPEGYAQLSNPLHGLDDRTIRQFQIETGTKLSDEATAIKENSSPQRFAARIHHFRTHPDASEAWIIWRCQKVKEFYQRMLDVVVSVRSDAQLFLVGGTMLDHPDMRSHCQPSLLSGSQLPGALRMIGFDFSQWNGMNSLVFLKPERLSFLPESENVLCYRDFTSPEWKQLYEQFDLRTLPLFFHDTENRFTLIPSGEQVRRRFVKQLVQRDVSLLFDGGNSLPTLENDSFYDFLAAFRQLPPETFRTYSPEERKTTEKPGQYEDSSQPITIRYLKSEDNLFVYLINDAPFENNITIRFGSRSPITLSELGGRRQLPQPNRDGSSFRWQIGMKAYDFVAFKLKGDNVAIEKVDVERPFETCGPEGFLKQKVDLLSEKIRRAQRGIVWDKLQNANCEPSSQDQGILHGWENFGRSGFDVQLDSNVKCSGHSSLKLSKDHSPDIGVLYSNSFDVPPTGRLFVSFSIGLLPNEALPPLDVVLAGKIRDNTFMRSFKTSSVLKTRQRQSNLPNEVYWQTIVVPFDRLPTQDLDNLRLGFILAGPSTLWIDDVKLYQIAFTKDEMNILYRLVSVADRRCSNGRISDLLAILDGHWAQFLFRNVPLDSSDKQDSSTARAVDLGISKKETLSPKAATPMSKTAEKSAMEKPKNESNGFFDRFKKWLNP